MGQGLVTSTGAYAATSAVALMPVRQHLKDVAVMPAFIDDLTAVVKFESALDCFDRTREALRAAGGELNMLKLKVLLPDPDAVGQAALDAMTAALRKRGVLPANIISHDTPPELRGVKLLGAPIGHDEYALALLTKRTTQIEEEGVELGKMAASYPMEACRILTAALSKRLDHAARQNSPTSRVLSALDTADKLMLSVLALILEPFTRSNVV